MCCHVFAATIKFQFRPSEGKSLGTAGLKYQNHIIKRLSAIWIKLPTCQESVSVQYFLRVFTCGAAHAGFWWVWLILVVLWEPKIKKHSALWSFLKFYPFIQYNIPLKALQNWQWQSVKLGSLREMRAEPTMPDLPEDQHSNQCFLWNRQRTRLGSCWPKSWPHISEGQTDSTLVVFSKVLHTTPGVQMERGPRSHATARANRFVSLSFLNCFRGHQHAPRKPRSSPERRLRSPPKTLLHSCSQIKPLICGAAWPSNNLNFHILWHSRVLISSGWQRGK